MEAPAHPAEDGRVADLAVAAGGDGPVARPVAFDAEDVPLRVGGVGDGEVDGVAASADGRDDPEAAGFEGGADGLFEGAGLTRREAAAGLEGRQAALGVVEVVTEAEGAGGGRAGRVDVGGAERGDDDGLPAGAGDGDVEARSPFSCPMGPKFMMRRPSASRP